MKPSFRPSDGLFVKYFSRYAEAEANSVRELVTKALSCHTRVSINRDAGMTNSNAESDIFALPSLGSADYQNGREGPYWQHSLVIPAYAERFQQLQKVSMACALISRVLQIWVINCPENAESVLVRQTRQCLRECVANSRSVAVHNNLLLRQFEWGQVLLVDRCSEGQQLNSKFGVGGARKIGGDIALKLYEMGYLGSAWCGFTDADVSLPSDYFERLRRITSSAAALVFPHRHKPEGDSLQRQAIACYQRKLDLHVTGLREAGSPYAFYTIGSTIACHLKNYLQVRGVPPRAAGEDFYFLNKLAKTGTIEQLSGRAIILSGRRSLRVPFGTGPAIDSALKPGTSEIYCYNPGGYRMLAGLLSSLADFWEQKKHVQAALVKLAGKLNRILQESGSLAANDLPADWIRHIALAEALAVMLGKSASEAAFRRHFHCWFDALRTLKFIHWWRDHALPDIALNTGCS